MEKRIYLLTVTSLLLIILPLLSCKGKRVHTVSLGPLTITHFQFHPIDDFSYHATFNLQSSSNILSFLSSLDLNINESRRINLVRQQTLPPQSLLEVYIRNIDISPGSIFKFEIIIDGAVYYSGNFKIESFLSERWAGDLEKDIGTEEFQKFHGKTY